MAATGFTPISLYYSTTASAVPLAANLANGELALNTADMKLYSKNSSGVVTLLASSGGATGTVSSVAMSVPTGLTVSGTPITTSGTLAVTLTAGYSIPTTASQTNWDTAYTDRLKWDGGATGLVAATGRTSLGGTTVGQNFFLLTNPSAITFPRINADNTVSALDAATFRTAIGAGTGSGTVTGVTATSPVASSGGTAPVISLSTGYGDTLNPYASKTANFFLAAPNGAAGVPSFRAVVAADIPTLNQSTTGNAATATTATNLAGGSAGTIPYQSAAGTTVQLTAGTAGYILQANGAAAPSWVVASTAAGVNNGTLTLNVSGTGLSGSQTFTANQSTAATFTVTSNATNLNTASTIVARDASGNFTAGTITAALTGNASTATSATTATNLAGGAVGSIAYQSAAGATTFLADVATGNAVISGGVGVAPSYGKIGLTTHVSGTLPVANGGTGQTTYTNGELLIGNTTGNTLTKATLSPGTGISITNGAGTITIASTASGDNSLLWYFMG